MVFLKDKSVDVEQREAVVGLEAGLLQGLPLLLGIFKKHSIDVDHAGVFHLTSCVFLVSPCHIKSSDCIIYVMPNHRFMQSF